MNANKVDFEKCRSGRKLTKKFRGEGWVDKAGVGYI